MKFKKIWPEIIIFSISFAFSWWLMWRTFNYQNGIIYVASKAWSDFAANIPLIRSFSWGKNFFPQYPLFPGEPIRYHFLFYLFVGLLEKAGLPLDWALNLPSLVGFGGLLVLIYLLAKLLFEKREVGLLAVVFFLLNGSLSFLEFFRQHPLSLDTFKEIFNNRVFPSFGPYDSKTVTAFWNLNIYTNQRHLAASYLFFLLIVYLLAKSVKNQKSLRLGRLVLITIIIGLLPFFHKVVFVMSFITLFFLFILIPQLRKTIFLIAILAFPLTIPQLVYQLRGSGLNSFSLHLGYLIPRPLTLAKFASYWFFNLGLSLALIPLGFLFSPKLAKKIFLSVFPLFIVANLFQFSPEIAANHKFFNLFLIIGNMFSAWVIHLVWKKKSAGKILAFILIFFLTLSGIIDFFPVKNDFLHQINDTSNSEVLWIKNHTPPDSVFLNSSYLYHPASLAGRKIFLGWPYFSWSAGYDTDKRTALMNKIWSNDNLDEVCKLLKQNKIYGVVLEKNSPDFPLNLPFWQTNFRSTYKNTDESFIIFFVGPNCP